MEKIIYKTSIRSLVEFMFRSGDITLNTGWHDPEAMLNGSRLHRKIQGSMKQGYQAEVLLSICTPVEKDGVQIDISVDGRADGIFVEDSVTIIDEIKCTYADVEMMEKPVMLHQAQAMCYAYITLMKKNLSEIGIQMTYCNIETENIKRFKIQYDEKEIKRWYGNLMEDYKKWAIWQIVWQKERNNSIKGTKFPFPYRDGQRELVKGVYKTILRKKKLYIEAPTGVGKTISTVYPAVMAMGEGLIEKIFYLTAKTITRTAANEAFHLLSKKKVNLKVITLTAKEKICPLDEVKCNPESCLRAKGHFDRINDALYNILVSEHEFTREKLEEYAFQYMVCPFEMALDLSLWADVVICDYNYVFDPKVYLKRFFQLEKKQKYCFLIDEAHNLVDRAREMYSAVLVKEDFLSVKKIVRIKSRKLEKKLNACNQKFLQLKKEWREYQKKQDHWKYQIIKGADALCISLLNVLGEFDVFLKEYQEFEGRDQVMELYFHISHYLNMYELINESYEIYVSEDEEERFFIRLMCMNPSENLKRCLNKGNSAVFFSATLLPVRYYMEQLAGQQEDYAVYAPSSFSKNKRMIAIGNDVSTKYTNRNEEEYHKMVSYIYKMVKSRIGNYIVFFPSYQYMERIYKVFHSDRWLNKFQNMDLVIQTTHMKEQEKEQFLEGFTENPSKTLIGFCVMGGIFGEGIDLKKSRLIGVVIVGTGLPMICEERELFRNYYEGFNEGMGFSYAYLYQGMNKVLQSAGRVIRTMEDYGIILLLDYRFLYRQYQNLFPKEWFPYDIVNVKNIEKKTNDFWKKIEEVLHDESSII